MMLMIKLDKAQREIHRLRHRQHEQDVRIGALMQILEDRKVVGGSEIAEYVQAEFKKRERVY